MRIIIQGAGIAGLTLASALQKRGIDFLLIEKVGEIRPVGAGITLGSNALRELSSVIDIGKLSHYGQTIDELQLLDNKGDLIASTPSRLSVESPSGLAIHRRYLHQSLLHSVSQEKIKLGTEVTSWSAGQRQVSVELSDGTKHEADYLVGADGLHSVVRTKLFPEAKLSFCGYTCWRSVVDYKLQELDKAVEVWGQGRRFGIVPISPKDVYIFLTLNVSQSDYERRATDRTPEYILKSFSSFPKLVTDVLARALESGKLIHNDIEELVHPLWGKQRVILIGDAAHAMTPDLGQGAAMGVEDATTLAEIFSAPTISAHPEAALSEFVSQRQKRVDWVARKARELGRVGQLEGRVATWMRNEAMRLTPTALLKQNLRYILEQGT